MARCRFVTPHVIRLPLSDGDWLDVKRELNAGETLRVWTNLVKEFKPGERPTLRPELVGRTKILEYVVGWSLVDAKGEPVAFTSAALDGLDTDSYAEIVAVIDTHDEEVEKAQAERKKSQGGESTLLAILPSAS